MPSMPSTITRGSPSVLCRQPSPSPSSSPPVGLAPGVGTLLGGPCPSGWSRRHFPCYSCPCRWRHWLRLPSPQRRYRPRDSDTARGPVWRREELVDCQSGRCAERQVQLARLLTVEKLFEPEVRSSRCLETHVARLVDDLADAERRQHHLVEGRALREIGARQDHVSEHRANLFRDTAPPDDVAEFSPTSG